MTADPRYKMGIELGVLDHLGLNLYSNMPAVLSEAVANAWDADAKKVTITIDKSKQELVIRDDGSGMDLEDINNRFLMVGYRRREEGRIKTPSGRHVMGRKGIGKLSLFSIADRIEVRSVKVDENGTKSEPEALAGGHAVPQPEYRERRQRAVRKQLRRQRDGADHGYLP